MESAMNRCTSRMFTGFVDGPAPAAVVAGVLADAARRAGQRIVQHYRLARFFQPVLF